MSNATAPHEIQRSAAPSRARSYRVRMTTRVLALLIAALGALVVTPATAADAADTPRCVSMREAARVDDSTLSIEQIHRIFDTRGRFAYHDEDTETSGRTYRSCRKGTLVQVDYELVDGVWRWMNQALYEP